MKPSIHIYSERKPLMRTPAEVLEILVNGPDDDGDTEQEENDLPIGEQRDEADDRFISGYGTFIGGGNQ